MKKTNVKSEISTIAIILVLVFSMTASIAIIPSVRGHDPPWSLPTYMYVNVTPNPIGVEQKVIVNLWLNTPPPTAWGEGVYGDLWENMTLVIKSPDGKTETKGPYISYSTGGLSITYIPNLVGNYTFQSFFGGQTLTNPNPNPMLPPNPATGDYFQPSQSEIFTLTVQEEPIPGPFVNPLPNTYWTRPIYGTNNNWYSIGGNWLAHEGRGLYNATGNYAPYTSAPTTAHILWTKPEAFGGMIGGEFGDSQQSNYYSTRQYEVMFTPIIINGVLYYNHFPGSATSPAGWVAVDLRTGQTLWTSNSPLTLPDSPRTPDTVPTAGPSTKLTYGQILNYYSPNQYGGLAYLWSTGTPEMVASTTKIGAGTTTYNMFDAMTGNYILSIVNGTGFSAVMQDESGGLIGYYLNASTANEYNAPTLNMWNSTKAILKYGWDMFVMFGLDVWRPPQGGIIPFRDGIEWSAPLATNISGVPIALSYSALSSGIILMSQYGTTGGSIAFQGGWIVEAGYSAVNGQLLWGPINRTQNVNTRVSYGTTGNGNQGYSIGDGVLVECDLNAMTVTGYNLFTGAKLWGPKDLPNAHPYTSYGLQQIVANGAIYIWTYGGDVYGINIQTGAINWQYHSPPLGMESPYGVEILWPSSGCGVIAGDLLIIGGGHEFVPPLYHGAHMLAFNTTNGQIVWNITGFFVNGVKAISDGILTTINAYDNQIYAFGKGPSKTTVEAPMLASKLGDSIIIRGTVTDISAGTTQNGQDARFPNGVPAVSDDSMSAWMEYVYMQKPRPTDTVGVPVKLEAIDPNGNYQDLGTATSDASGNYGFTFEPEVPGQYLIMATFYGSGGYYGSTTTTYLTVDPAPEPYPTVTIPPYPGYQGPTAADVAQNVLDNLPDDPTAGDIAQEVLNQLPEYPEPTEAPEYTTIDIVIIVAVVVVAALVVYTLYTVKKQK